MADTKGGPRIGDLLPILNFGSGAYTNFVLDASTDQLEFIFNVPEAITITTLLVRQGVITGTAPVYIASLQGVDASGNPDGTIKGGGTPASVTFTPVAGNASKIVRLTLANSYVTTRGEFLALVVAYSSGTIDASNSVSFTARSAGYACQLPYHIENNAGVRTRNFQLPIFGYASSTKAYGIPIESILVSRTISDATNPDEVGIMFTRPAGSGDTYTVRGVFFPIKGRASGLLTARIYDTDGTTVLQAVDLDTDATSVSGGSNRMVVALYFDEASLSALTYGSNYRATLRMGATGNITWDEMTLNLAADRDAFPHGQDIIFTSQNNVGGFTQTGTILIEMGIIVDDETEPAAGGGLLTHPGMGGGMRS